LNTLRLSSIAVGVAIIALTTLAVVGQPVRAAVKPQMVIVPSPVPAPTPRTPTATDLAQLAAVGPAQQYMSSVAIVGNYAEVCWTSGNVGGCILASNTSGSWTKLDGTKGCYNTDDIASRAPSIPAAIAQQLVTQAALNQI